MSSLTLRKTGLLELNNSSIFGPTSFFCSDKTAKITYYSHEFKKKYLVVDLNMSSESFPSQRY